MSPDRPVKLTFPAREPGARRIMAGKLQVGHVLADHKMRWTVDCRDASAEAAYEQHYPSGVAT